MRLTKRQKIGLGVLALGLVAVAIDQAFIFSGGQPAHAAGPVAAEPITTTENNAQIPAPNRRSADLAHKLQLVGYEPGSLPDTFSMPDSWIAQPQERAERAPQSRYVLTSVVVTGPDAGVARINNRLFRVGQTRGGVRLISVDQRSAEVEIAGRRQRLELVDPALVP